MYNVHTLEHGLIETHTHICMFTNHIPIPSPSVREKVKNKETQLLATNASAYRLSGLKVQFEKINGKTVGIKDFCWEIVGYCKVSRSFEGCNRVLINFSTQTFWEISRAWQVGGAHVLVGKRENWYMCMHVSFLLMLFAVVF